MGCLTAFRCAGGILATKPSDDYFSFTGVRLARFRCDNERGRDLPALFDPASIAGVVFGDAGKLDWRAVGEAGDQRQAAADRFNSPAQRGQQQVAPLLQPRNGVLTDAELARDARLGQRAGLA